MFRFRGGYFAVGTWAVAEVYRLAIANSAPLGRGSGRTLAAVFPLARDTREVLTYWLALVIGPDRGPLGRAVLPGAASRQVHGGGAGRGVGEPDGRDDVRARE